MKITRKDKIKTVGVNFFSLFFFFSELYLKKNHSLTIFPLDALYIFV